MGGHFYAPEDDPLYDPMGFDFGYTPAETTTTTDKSGVQVQNGVSVNTTAKSADNGNSNSFPRNGVTTNSAQNLNLRSGPDGAIIGKIPPRAQIQVLAEHGDWAQVSFNGKRGWASRSYLAYDKGGLMTGKGIAFKDVLSPERVLDPVQTKSFDKLVNNLTNPALAKLIKLPNINNVPIKEDITEPIDCGDTYNISNVTVKANNFSEFVNSMQAVTPFKKR